MLNTLKLGTMKNSMNLIKIIFLCASILFTMSCAQKSGKDEKSTDQEQVGNNKNVTSSESMSGDLYTIKISGQEVGKISVNGSELKFIIKGTEYQSKLNGDKRKYAVKSGDIIAEVKYKDDAFKVRTPSGDLLWKIKLYDDKVKISNNEENLNGYDIKMSPDKVKVKKEDATIGEARLKIEDKIVEISSSTKSYTIDATKLSLAYGVLLIDEIPENLQYIIMAELIAKGK
jgi:hypothetical protein